MNEEKYKKIHMNEPKPVIPLDKTALFIAIVVSLVILLGLTGGILYLLSLI